MFVRLLADTRNHHEKLRLFRASAIHQEKSDHPHKVCFTKYHGKERQTYVVITIIHNYFIDVKTVWLKQGK